VLPEGVEHLDVQAGEVRLHCAAMGPRDGPLVVLLHGFPECWVSWRHQLPALAGAGLRAVAPDLRGYGGSDKPLGVGAYRIENLARDVAELIGALGRERADVVGHDWGAHVAWHLAMWHPQRVRRLAILNMPHPERMRRGLRTARQLGKSWYMFFFQLPILPERFMSPRRLRGAFLHTPERKGAYDEADIDAIVAAVGDRTAPINYYRAAARYRSPPWQPVRAETLVIWGQRDRWLGEELAEPDPRWVPRARVERIPGASHWVQADAPERVNDLLRSHLGEQHYISRDTI
jgi:pimeloyl-ACP methyl ester carboxylesterase